MIFKKVKKHCHKKQHTIYAALHLAFFALQDILEIFPYQFIQSYLIIFIAA